MALQRCEADQAAAVLAVIATAHVFHSVSYIQDPSCSSLQVSASATLRLILDHLRPLYVSQRDFARLLELERLMQSGEPIARSAACNKQRVSPWRGGLCCSSHQLISKSCLRLEVHFRGRRHVSA